jgi:hypothetical protein
VITPDDFQSDFHEIPLLLFARFDDWRLDLPQKIPIDILVANVTDSGHGS